MGWKDRVRKCAPQAWEFVACHRGRGYYGAGAARFGGIFIQIPRTGTTSITRVVGGIGKPHHRAVQFRQANPRKFAKYFKFAFVRNPWDRAVSSYEFLLQGGTDANGIWREEVRRHARTALGETRSFEQFVIERLRTLDTHVHFRPQNYYIFDGENLMDFTGRYERLAEDFAVVAEVLGVNPKLPHENASGRRDWKSYYTPETYKIVGEVYQTDIELFGY